MSKNKTMACLQCGGATKKPTMKFCSIQCKSEAQKGKREPLDPSKNIKCLIDGKMYDDYENRSGCLRRYSESVLKKEFDWADWEIVAVDVKEKWKCPHCDWNTVDIDNKSGWITTHLADVHGISPSDHCEDYPDDKKLWIEYWKQRDLESFKNESEDNRVQCLECGEYFRRINNRHLMDKHGMTLQEYDLKYPNATRQSVSTTTRARDLYFSDNGLSNSNYDSNGQVEIKEFIEALGFVAQKYRSSMYEIDIYIPELKLGIEYNGLFHHSEFRSGRGEKYHVGKTKCAEVDGIKLIQIFDDEWNHKQAIVKSRLANLLGKAEFRIPARKCDIRLVHTADIRKFLEENHLQGYSHSSVSVGLYFENELIQCMTFNSNRSVVGGKSHVDDHYELVRLCSKLHFNVIGGAERMLTYFERQYSPNLIVSYADRRWTSTLGDSVYSKLGFEYLGTTDPCFWGTSNYTRRNHHRSFFTKKNMLEKFKSVLDGVDTSGMTQAKMMEFIGFDRVWDCGNLKYAKKYDVVVDIPEDEEYEDTEYHFLGNRNRRGSVEAKNDSDVKCELCQLYYPSRGIAMHLKYTHHTDPTTYMAEYGEYRKSILAKKS